MVTLNQISMHDLESRLSSLKPDELILDVRTEEEYKEGHVPGSRNIPYDKVSLYAEELRGYKKIYIHCKAGGRAGKASQTLLGLGLNNLVCISGSGMDDWIESGYPVEKGGK